jgi:SHS2 domain-containing protein
MKKSGFREIEHTADWELEVWAHDLLALLSEAAKGMYYLSGARLSEEPRLEREFLLDASDPETLLVDFLSELLFYGENEGLGFDRFDLVLDGSRLKARIEGARLASHEKEIKAVTYHGLKVEQDEDGFKARLIFDV